MHWFWRGTIAVVVTATLMSAFEKVVGSLVGTSRPTVAFIPDGGTISTSPSDSTAWLWNAVTGQSSRHKRAVYSVAFSPDGSRLRMIGPSRTAQALQIGYQLVLPLVLCLIVYGVLTKLVGPRVLFDGYTRCRACEHILRGITEPRCPECGERI